MTLLRHEALLYPEFILKFKGRRDAVLADRVSIWFQPYIR